MDQIGCGYGYNCAYRSRYRCFGKWPTGRILESHVMAGSIFLTMKIRRWLDMLILLTKGYTHREPLLYMYNLHHASLPNTVFSLAM